MSASAVSFPCLLADVGGTNARFALLASVESEVSPMLRLDTAGEADFAETVRRAIASGGFPAPRSMLLAVAGPLAGRRAALSNARADGRPVTVDGDALAEAFDLEQGLLLNDFEALSLSLPFLAGEALIQIGGPAPEPGPMMVVGPGTGLGVGGLVAHEGRWLPIASEGGHATLGPATAEERAFWPLLGDAPLSAEDLLSGRGITRLYRAAVAQSGARPLDDSPPAVAERALAAAEPAASEAVRRLFLLLARFAADMALVFGARGGAYIGGGIAPRLLPAMDRAAFLAAFQVDGRAGGYLSGVPLRMIVAPDAALIGLAAVARRPQDFALDYERRRWRRPSGLTRP